MFLSPAGFGVVVVVAVGTWMGAGGTYAAFFFGEDDGFEIFLDAATGDVVV